MDATSSHLDLSHAAKLDKAFVQKITIKEPVVSEVRQECQPKLNALATQEPPPVLDALVGGARSL